MFRKIGIFLDVEDIFRVCHFVLVASSRISLTESQVVEACLGCVRVAEGGREGGGGY